MRHLTRRLRDILLALFTLSALGAGSAMAQAAPHMLLGVDCSAPPLWHCPDTECQAAVVTQAGIGIAVEVGIPADQFVVPDGEGAKSLTVVEDLVSRKWIADILSTEETSTQVQIVFGDALAAEGLLALVEERADAPVDPSVDDERRPILLAISDNGPQMTSGSTREFMALCAIAQHFGRPGTPTDQAWIESFNGHLKAEYPHLERITDPAVLRAELDVIRPHWNGVRLHAGIGYVTPNDEHEGRGPGIRKAREAGLESARLRRITYHRNEHQQQPDRGPHDVV